MPKVDLDSIEQVNRTGYPPPFNEAVAGRWQRRLAPATGLTDFGVSHVVLKPGAWSSQRHWHLKEDEFVYILSGEVVLITDKGEEILRAGDCAAFPKNDGNGHHLINRSNRDVQLLEIGTRSGGDTATYPDIDLALDPAKGFTRKDGTPHL